MIALNFKRTIGLTAEGAVHASHGSSLVHPRVNAHAIALVADS